MKVQYQQKLLQQNPHSREKNFTRNKLWNRIRTVTWRWRCGRGDNHRCGISHNIIDIITKFSGRKTSTLTSAKFSGKWNYMRRLVRRNFIWRKGWSVWKPKEWSGGLLVDEGLGTASGSGPGKEERSTSRAGPKERTRLVGPVECCSPRESEWARAVDPNVEENGQGVDEEQSDGWGNRAWCFSSKAWSTRVRSCTREWFCGWAKNWEVGGEYSYGTDGQ